jgi:hypothetical protein
MRKMQHPGRAVEPLSGIDNSARHHTGVTHRSVPIVLAGTADTRRGKPRINIGARRCILSALKSLSSDPLDPIWQEKTSDQPSRQVSRRGP